MVHMNGAMVEPNTVACSMAHTTGPCTVAMEQPMDVSSSMRELMASSMDDAMEGPLNVDHPAYRAHDLGTRNALISRRGKGSCSSSVPRRGRGVSRGCTTSRCSEVPKFCQTLYRGRLAESRRMFSEIIDHS